MPTILRGRIALVLAFAVLLIPVFQSSLRGLTHVLTCSEQVAQPFIVQIAADGSATILSSTSITPGQDKGVCGGLVLTMGVQADDPGAVEVILPITNTTDDTWRGTVGLDIGDTSLPVSIGEIGPGETREDRIRVRFDEGTHELQGSVLIGP